MTLTHIHLLLNHVPVIGTILATLLLAAALVRRSDDLTKASLSLFALLGVVALVVFLTGEPAEEAVEHLTGFSHGIVERHEEAALISTVIMSFLAVVSIVAVLAFRKRAMPRWVVGLIFVAAVGTSGFMGWTANLGGQVRHTEIRPGGVVVDDDDRDGSR